MSKSHRSAYAKFRSGVAPIRIETGRYERLDYSDRTCYNCAGEVESEMHVFLYCPVYQTLREDMLATLTSEFPDIDSFTDDQKLSSILSCQHFRVRTCGKICHGILNLRRDTLYRI